jgi:hypothetical protein
MDWGCAGHQISEALTANPVLLYEPTFKWVEFYSHFGSNFPQMAFE